MNHKRGQSTVEYAVLIAVVAAALLGVQFYAKRAVQGRVKASADQIGDQFVPAATAYSIAVANDGARLDTLSTDGASKSEVTVEEKSSRNATSWTAPALPTTGDIWTTD